MEPNYKEMLSGVFTLDIPNFTKWNPSMENGKRRSWFKLDVHFFQDPRIVRVGSTAATLFLHLLTFRARSKQDLTNIDVTSLRLRCNFQGTSIQLLLAKLLKSGLITIQIPLLEKRREEKKEEKENIRASQNDAAPAKRSRTQTVSPKSEPKTDPKPDPDDPFANAPGFGEDVGTKPKDPPKPFPFVRKKGWGPNNHLVVKAYRACYEGRYKSKPHVGNKERGVIKSLLQIYDADEVVRLVRTYLASDRYVRRKHDLICFGWAATLNELLAGGGGGKRRYDLGG